MLRLSERARTPLLMHTLSNLTTSGKQHPERHFSFKKVIQYPPHLPHILVNLPVRDLGDHPLLFLDLNPLNFLRGQF